MNNGYFGMFGGQHVPAALEPVLQELASVYQTCRQDPDFQAELKDLMEKYAGRPSRLYYAKNMTADLGGAKIYLKREDLNHTGSHKINNALGQALVAKRMGKTRLIAETGAGSHGVATATVAALMGMECAIYMGKTDVERQILNVYRMQLLGAEVIPVTSGTMGLKDAVDVALENWVTQLDTTHYLIGSVVGPHPFPLMVRDFQKIIGQEIKAQITETEGKLPDAVIACVGGGSNAMGAFYEFIDDSDVQLIGCEAGGLGLNTPHNAASITLGSAGTFHGMHSLFNQTKDGNLAPVHSISAGLDYPGVGPEHANLHTSGRAKYAAITDQEAVEAFCYLSRMEGIIPALESSHAIAYALKIAGSFRPDQVIVINLSGRGDKDVDQVAKYQGMTVIL